MGIDYYYPRTYSYGCINEENIAWGDLSLYKYGELVLETEFRWDKIDYYMKQLDLTAGGYDAVIQTHWEGFNVQDYTFRINSKE
jgi:hypothetical protein